MQALLLRQNDLAMGIAKAIYERDQNSHTLDDPTVYNSAASSVVKYKS
tara:strand:- start:7 stop:150 length:144 start_codon:yes stop_codon:yes gene_type:complete